MFARTDEFVAGLCSGLQQVKVCFLQRKQGFAVKFAEFAEQVAGLIVLMCIPPRVHPRQEAEKPAPWIIHSGPGVPASAVIFNNPRAVIDGVDMGAVAHAHKDRPTSARCFHLQDVANTRGCIRIASMDIGLTLHTEP